MDNGPGWLLDPADGDRERYWNGSDWTDRVRPAGKARALRLPDHVPELQRALAGATADIDAVEDRLSAMFDRTATPAEQPTPRTQPTRRDTEDPDGVNAFDDLSDQGDEAFAELDAALAAEEAEKVDDADEVEEPKKPKRGLFRRRT